MPLSPLKPRAGPGLSQHMTKPSGLKGSRQRTSLVVQWLRIHLPMEGMWVRSRVGEGPTCCRAAKLVCQHY